jgi:hypothetical protein
MARILAAGTRRCHALDAASPDAACVVARAASSPPRLRPIGSALGVRMGLPLDLFVLLATLVYVAVGLAVGIRLLRLARRTRAFPELALGLGECLLAGAVPPLFIVAQAVAEPEALVRAAAFAGHLAYTVGCAVMIAFTWRVFRPGSGWALVLVYGAVGVLGGGGLVGMARVLLVPDVTGLRDPQTTAFLVMEWVSFVGFLWTAGEAFHLHGRLRKQRALGLSDPVVVNRVLLWGVVGLGGVAAAGAPILASLLGQNVSTHVPTRLVCALATAVSSGAAQLAFLPPASYLRWLRA